MDVHSYELRTNNIVGHTYLFITLQDPKQDIDMARSSMPWVRAWLQLACWLRQPPVAARDTQTPRPCNDSNTSLVQRFGLFNLWRCLIRISTLQHHLHLNGTLSSDECGLIEFRSFALRAQTKRIYVPAASPHCPFVRPWSGSCRFISMPSIFWGPPHWVSWASRTSE